MLAFILFSRKSTQICQNCCLLLNKTKYKPLFISLWLAFPHHVSLQSSPLPSWPTLNQPLCLINNAWWIVVFFFSNSFFWFAHSLCPLSLIPGWLVSLINNTLTGSKVKILICSSHLSFYKAASLLKMALHHPLINNAAEMRSKVRVLICSSHPSLYKAAGFLANGSKSASNHVLTCGDDENNNVVRRWHT